MPNISIEIKCGDTTCDNCDYLHFSVGYCLIRYYCDLFHKYIGDFKKPRIVECLKLQEDYNGYLYFKKKTTKGETDAVK